MNSSRKPKQSFSERVKSVHPLLLPLLGGLVLLGLLAAMAAVTWNDYQSALMDSQTRQLELVVQSIADSIQFSLAECTDRLDAAADKLRTNPDAQPSLARSDTLTDLWVEDADGTITYSCYGVTPVCDVLLTQSGTISYWQYHRGDHPYLVLKEPAGEQTVCLVVDSKAVYDQLVSDIHVGTNGYIVVKTAANRIVMHPEAAQWGIDILDGRRKLYRQNHLDMDSLEGLLEMQLTQSSGIMDYYSYWWTDPTLPRVRKISAFRKLPLGSSFWTVSAVVDYDDLYQPVAESFRKMALMFGAVALVLVLLTAFILRLKQKNDQKSARIRSLQEVNNALEELHRSEEFLQHGQRLQLMGTLTGGIAHEFNNFLTPITGYADLIMADADPSSEIYDNAREISEAAEKARDVVKQISAMGRKNVETIYDAVPVDKLLTQTRKLVETNCPKTIALELTTDLNGEQILGNQTQLQQVLLNICINGIHAIGKQPGSLRIHADTVPREELICCFPDENLPKVWPEYVRIQIADTGSGMDRETLQHIFEPFFTTKKTGEGTGLGLALAEQIISTHRGYIRAESTVGKGSTFFLYLPVLEQERERAQLQWGQESALRILAADDNQKVLSMLSKDLSELGLTVSTCSRQTDLQQLLNSQPFDVLLIDETLVEASGVDFCMSIQGTFPGLTRIVMASTPSRALMDAKMHGIIDGYVLKPVSASLLLEQVQAARQKPQN